MNGRLTVEQAGREVLLCGGAINSPQLLMLSGIGPADHLRTLGIEVVADLPGVGENLQDHLASGAVYSTTKPISLNNAERTRNVLKYLFFRQGPLTSSVAEAGAFIKTRPDAPVPDIQFHFAPVFFRGHGLEPAPGHGFTIGPTLLHPRSRGRILLRSSEPTAPAVIHANYFQSEEDVRVMLAGLKIAHEIAQTRAFAELRGPELAPATWQRPDSELIQVMRETSETLYHPCGTCKMGPANDETAVVDARLRVRGVEGLRVIDASIMPTVVGGNTNAPTIMIAEKAADLLRYPATPNLVEEQSEKAGRES